MKTLASTPPLLTSAWWFVLILLLPAYARQLECPSTIHVEESADLTQMQDWRGYDTIANGIHRFRDVGFSEGPPEKLVFRTPSKTAVAKKSKVERYDFSPQGSEEIWMSCYYSDTGRALTRKIAEKISRCEVTYDPTTSFRTVKRIDCF